VRRALAIAAALGALSALLVEVWARPPRARSAAEGGSAHTVTALELATWIHDRKPGLRIVDQRSKAAYDWYHLPGAERASAPSGEILVLADGNTYVLRGGMQTWLDMLKSPTPVARYFGGPPRRGGC
jgi:rhodanese-related sulfurtransferase